MGMITDADVKKLKAVFATKDDLVSMEKRQNARFTTKDDLNRFPTKLDLEKALKDQTEVIVDGVSEYIADTIAPMFDGRDRKITRIEKKLNLPPLAD